MRHKNNLEGPKMKINSNRNYEIKTTEAKVQNPIEIKFIYRQEYFLTKGLQVKRC